MESEGMQLAARRPQHQESLEMALCWLPSDHIQIGCIFDVLRVQRCDSVKPQEQEQHLVKSPGTLAVSWASQR